ncbi:lipid A deacylase LpxR family protein [Undibacterium jejuense]|uniref:Lipid A deacylase LpxR family protein n=1 Tax=Undibacterium jejuense TaxID=1344949 RepID=A0A923HH75_9BURK|nr:lipid A deacylase LpxR family protein [Undibacterium jejuense]MBC3861587.1 lipid A deacylase LpxR family protein [Undibacterium jejuense]
MKFSQKVLASLVALACITVSGIAAANDNASANFSAPSWQQAKTVMDQGKAIWMLELENDSFLLNRDDKFYTAGDHLQKTYVVQSDLHSVEYGWRIAQDLYTPSDVKLLPSQLASNDHPYAGWLYGGIFNNNVDVTGKSWRWGVDIGCFGQCAGGARTQAQLHRLITQPLPQGWSTQYHNELGVVLSGEMSPGRLLPFAGVDITPKVHARFGNIFTDLGAEVAIRFGRLNALPYQPASYGFLRGDMKAVAYNATIEGAYFSKDIPKVHAKTAGGEIELGYVWQAGKYGATASIFRRANEIKEMSNAVGAQNVVRLQFLYAM